MHVLGKYWSKDNWWLLFCFSAFTHWSITQARKALPTCRWCHKACHVPIGPLFLWMRQVIQVAKDSLTLCFEIYTHTGCGGGGSWKMFMCLRELCVCLCVRVCLRYYFIDCVKVFVRNISLRTRHFYHSNDLTQLELRLMCLLPFSEFWLCVCLYVCTCVFFFRFFFCRGGEHRLVGASCLPSGFKVCMFPTNLQHTSKPKTTLPASVQLVCNWWWPRSCLIRHIGSVVGLPG